MALGLMLSGHTHGGQVNLPLLGSVYGRTPEQLRFKIGWDRLGDTQIYVSRGIGTIVLPWRLRCPAEIPCLTLETIIADHGRQPRRPFRTVASYARLGSNLHHGDDVLGRLSSSRMRAVDLIRRKRDSAELSHEEILFLIDAYTCGDIPDYQMSAWLMAAVCRGLTRAEIAALTEAMLHSGRCSRFPGACPARK